MAGSKPNYARGQSVPQGVPGEYEEYKLGERPFSKLHKDVPDWVETTRVWLMDKALRAAAALIAPHDTPTRVYKQAVLDRRTTPITEKDFTPAQLASLADAVQLAKSAGRDRLTPPDYRAGMKAGYDNNPWPSVIGQARLVPTQDGGVNIVDTYDFNNHERDGGTYDFGAAWYGRRALPSGIRGVPVKISLPRGMPSRPKRK